MLILSSSFFSWTTSTNMNKLYSKKTAASTVTALLGGVTALEGETIIETSSSGTDYFAKGHLSPDAAFIYNVQQDATYYFINVAPQVRSSSLVLSLTLCPSSSLSTTATGRR